MYFVQGDNSSLPTLMLAFLVERFLGQALYILFFHTKLCFVQGVKRAK